MTKGIEEMLNLPSLEDILKESGETMPTVEITEEVIDEEIEAVESTLKKAEESLAFTEGKDHGKAMDDLADEMLKHARDLMDFGFNTDSSRARGIFEVATSMYKNVMDAKNSKRDAQLKTMQVLLQQKRTELDELRTKHEIGQQSTIEADAVIVEDRNELIKRLREQAKLAKPS